MKYKDLSVALVNVINEDKKQQTLKQTHNPIFTTQRQNLTSL